MKISSSELRQILPYGLASKFAKWNPFSLSQMDNDAIALNQLKQYIDGLSRDNNYNLTNEECITVIRLGLACKAKDVDGLFSALGINQFQALLRYLQLKANALVTLKNIEALSQGMHRWQNYNKVTKSSYDYESDIREAILILNDADTKFLKLTQDLFEALVYFPGVILLARILREMNYDGFRIVEGFLEATNLIGLAKKYGLNIGLICVEDQIRVFNICIEAANQRIPISEVIIVLTKVLQGVPEIAKNAHVLFQAKYNKQQNLLQLLPVELLIHIASIAKTEIYKLNDKEAQKIAIKNFTKPNPKPKT